MPKYNNHFFLPFLPQRTPLLTIVLKNGEKIVGYANKIHNGAVQIIPDVICSDNELIDVRYDDIEIVSY